MSAENRLQEINRNQLKLKVAKIYKKKGSQITTNFEPRNDEDVVSKAYMDGNLSTVAGYISHTKEKVNEIEKNFENCPHKTKKLIDIEVKTIVHLLYDIAQFNNNDNSDEVPKEFLVNDLEESCRERVWDP